MKVNLDSLIPREDFEANRDGDAPVKQTIDIKDLASDAFFYSALRKPDFQRETTEWDSQRVVGLIQTFLEGDLVPAVILWKNKELLFVIDGSHRLSALVAWVNDDYGDGALSQEFFNHSIPDEQEEVGKKTRELVKKAIGSYADHQDAIKDPSKFGPDILERARALGSRPLQLQWVRGTAEKAEESFIRINRKAVNISPQELELIEKRRKPQTIAARAIKSKGTGHKYWAGFAKSEQARIEELAREIHGSLFEPSVQHPLDSLSLPPGGQVYASPTLRMVYDFVAICVGVVSSEDDADGHRTIDYLTRCRRVMLLLLSRDPSSMGLHPAIYFYSWTGSQQPILFLAISSMIINLDRGNLLGEFTEARKGLEEFLFRNRMLLAQLVRKFGTKASGFSHVTDFYMDVLGILNRGAALDAVAVKLEELGSYSYLQPSESPYGGNSAPSKMSSKARSGLVMKKLLEIAPRCSICGGFVPPQSTSVDHVDRIAEGGLTTHENTTLTHPYCNTGHKERQVVQSKRHKADDSR